MGLCDEQPSIRMDLGLPWVPLGYVISYFFQSRSSFFLLNFPKAPLSSFVL